MNLVKLLWQILRQMGKLFKGLEKTLSEGSPMLMMGFYLHRTFPQLITFGNSIPGLIGWYPWLILVPGVL